MLRSKRLDSGGQAAEEQVGEGRGGGERKLQRGEECGDQVVGDSSNHVELPTAKIPRLACDVAAAQNRGAEAVERRQFRETLALGGNSNDGPRGEVRINQSQCSPQVLAEGIRDSDPSRVSSGDGGAAPSSVDVQHVKRTPTLRYDVNPRILECHLRSFSCPFSARFLDRLTDTFKDFLPVGRVVDIAT